MDTHYGNAGTAVKLNGQGDLLEFDYSHAFQRNLGFLSDTEQKRLQRSTVAVAGLGGTGGAQVHALARTGIGGFNLADPDTFELANFNRQLGATIDTVGCNKTVVTAAMVHSINPEASIRQFEQGISADNIDAFLDGADVVVDSLDFYCFDERFLLYSQARARGLWVLTAPPLGFGFTLLIYDPQGMRFEDYFGFGPDTDERERLISQVAGIAPMPYLLRYLDNDSASLGGGRLPSVGAAPFLIAGVIATEVVKIITGKFSIAAVPVVLQYDALLQKFRRRKYRMGMKSPLQRFKKAILRRRLPA